MDTLNRERNKLPAHERNAVTDEELRVASHVSDAEFIARMAELLPPGTVNATRHTPESR